MPRTLQRIHRNQTLEAQSAQKLARRLRETYVPSRLRRWIQEEAALMLAFDGAKDLDERLAALGGLIRVRLLIMRGIGWPKEPSMKGGRLPCALDAVKAHNPLGDVDVQDAVVLPEPVETPGTAPLGG